MGVPRVSFVVPCYKLAHVLPECVNSILAQTYGDFEVLIMDDRSPDHTAEVANSFNDRRICHIRNEENLGHLRNYNKGITLSRGKYVWLISADDYLRRPYVLERYVNLMEQHPRVGYAFCPGVGVQNGKESETLGYSQYGHSDRIVDGHHFLSNLLEYNRVVAASVLTRRDCYENISLFPLDAHWAGSPVEMGWVGDWYLWCVFALYFDIAYFAEPMVCYREHELSITVALTQNTMAACIAADVAVPWLIKQKADEMGLAKLSERCLFGAANQYARYAAARRYRSSISSMSIEQIELSLCHSTKSEWERNWIRSRTFAGWADQLSLREEASSAARMYLRALRKDPRMAGVYPKLLLLALGKPGSHLRAMLRFLRLRVGSLLSLGQ